MGSTRWNPWTTRSSSTPTGASWSASSTRAAAGGAARWLLAASGALLLAALALPARAAIECEPETPAAHAADADAVFAGQVIETFEDRSHPAPWLPGTVIAHWPPGLPLPTVEGSTGVPAVRFRAAVAYKGAVSAEPVVHLVGTGPHFARGQEWTVFASRDAGLGLFTTECSGDLRGTLDAPAAYGLAAHAVAGDDWRQALLGPLLVLAAIALLGGLAAGVQAARSRRRQSG